MEFKFNIITILDSVALLQGLIVGILLIVLSKKKYKSTFFLGLSLVLYSLHKITGIVIDLNILDAYPELFLLPVNSLWMLYPIFFIYTQQISILQNQKIKYWLLYPGILFYIFQIYIYFLPYETKLVLASETLFPLLYVSGLVFGWIIAIWNLKLIKYHKTEVNNQFSMTQYKELQWARTFLVVTLICSILYVIQFYLVTKNIYSRVFFVLYDLFVIYWISYHGVEQSNVLSIIATKTEIPANSESNEEQRAPAKNLDILDGHLRKLDEYMLTSERYVCSELNIVDLANSIKIHPKSISSAINIIREQNFNTYVNTFRIRKAELLLQDIKFKNLSIEGIGNEAGFRSKSAFYAAFKKVTGTTPTKYKSQYAA